MVAALQLNGFVRLIIGFRKQYDSLHSGWETRMEAIEQFYTVLPKSIVHLYKEMANKAIELGFKPKLDKTKH